MTVITTKKDAENLTLSIVAELDAGRERVWELWEDPHKLERWWGPPSFPAKAEAEVGSHATRHARLVQPDHVAARHDTPPSRAKRACISDRSCSRRGLFTAADTAGLTTEATGLTGVIPGLSTCRTSDGDSRTIFPSFLLTSYYFLGERIWRHQQKPRFSWRLIAHWTG